MAELIAATIVLPRRRPARSTPRARPATNLGECAHPDEIAARPDPAQLTGAHVAPLRNAQP
jgi:hypothetical protein